MPSAQNPVAGTGRPFPLVLPGLEAGTAEILLQVILFPHQDTSPAVDLAKALPQYLGLLQMLLILRVRVHSRVKFLLELAQFSSNDSDPVAQDRYLVIVAGLHTKFCSRNTQLLLFFENLLLLDVDPHERVLRRMLRHTSNRTLEEAVAWYRRDVIPNFPVHTEATRQYADLIIPFEGEVETGVEVVVNGIRAMIDQ